MSNIIKIKRSATPSSIPTTTDLVVGELAINSYDGKLFLKKDDGAETIVEVGTVVDATVTTTSTTQTTLHTFVHATYGAAEYIIQATQGTDRHITKVLVTHDGTTAISTEYGEVITGSSLYTVQVDISGSDARLLITTATTTSTVYKANYILIEA